MARLPRLVLPAQPHHIIQRGNNRQHVFVDEQDYRHYLGWLAEAARTYRVAIHAYVLMPNHVHLLASPADADGLARMMQWMGRRYVPYFNKKYQRNGTIWQGRFRTSVIDSEQYFMACSRYIEHNPVRAGLAARYEDYPWSSYMHHIGARSDPLVTDHALYWSLGNTPFQREAAYRDFLEQALTRADLDAFNTTFLKGWPLVTAQFKARVEANLQRRIGPAQRGRPRKKPAPIAT
jgi:putative transposase